MQSSILELLAAFLEDEEERSPSPPLSEEEQDNVILRLQRLGLIAEQEPEATAEYTGDQGISPEMRAQLMKLPTRTPSKGKE